MLICLLELPVHNYSVASSVTYLFLPDLPVLEHSGDPGLSDLPVLEHSVMLTRSPSNQQR